MSETVPTDTGNERGRSVAASHLPIFSVHGASAEQLRSFHQLVLPLLVAEGLLVATVRWVQGGGINGGKESRASDLLVDAGQWHWVWRGDRTGLNAMLRRVARSVDLVLLETEPEPDLRAITLRQLVESGAESIQIAGCEKDPRAAAAAIRACLARLQGRCPVWACILIGGKSSRMGRPKHLLPNSSGATWLERTVALVQPLVDGVVLSGAGEVPASLGGLPRLADIPAVAGPLTGILSAMRWQPEVAWLLLACDMPGLSTEAVRWLLAQRAVGCWGVVPQIAGARAVEPLFARYEPQCGELFEQLRLQGVRRIGRIAETQKVRVVPVPEHLRSGWQNVNTPEDLLGFSSQLPGS